VSRGKAQVGLSTADVAERSGLTLRQIRYLVGFGVFGTDDVSPGSGGRLSFTSDDVQLATVLCRLSHLATVLTGRRTGVSRGMAVDVASVLNATGSPPRWLAVTNGGKVIAGRAVPPLSDTCILMDLSG